MQVLSRAELEILLVPVDREAAASSSRNNATISAKEVVGDFSNISGGAEGLKVTIDSAKAEPSSRAVLETLRLLVQVRALHPTLDHHVQPCGDNPMFQSFELPAWNLMP